MPFLGKSPTAGFASIVKDDLTPNGSTTAFTLSKQVANANDIAVFLGNVRQEPTDAYTVSGTTLTMSAAPASGLNFYVLHIAGTLESSVVPADNTISTAKIQSNAITDAKITGMAASKLTGTVSNSQIANGAGGKLLNVYNNRINTDLEVGNGSRYNWTQSQITLTPVSTNSRFWIFLTAQSTSTTSATTGNLGLYRLSGGSYGTTTEIPEGTWQQRLYNARGNSADAAQNVSFQYYDSPSTTSSIRYVFYLERNNGPDSIFIGSTTSNRPSYLTIFEFDGTTITTGSDGI